MAKKLRFPFAILAAAVICAAIYLGWAGPKINSPLALDKFDEARTRNRVRVIAQSLLNTPGNFRLTLKQGLDGDALVKMHRLYGLEAANYWASRGVPVQRWSYSVYRDGGGSLDFRKQLQPVLNVDVSCSGAIQSIDRFIDKGAPQIPLSFEEARGLATNLLKLVGVDTGRLVLTGTKTSESEGSTVYDYIWKEPVENLPGMSYEYSVTIRHGYISSLKRSIMMPEEEEGIESLESLSLLAAGIAWCFLILITLILFIQGLRKDQVDMAHARHIALIAAILGFGWALSTPADSVFRALLTSVFMAILTVLLYGLLWIVGESILRQAAPEKLRHTDLLLEGRWNVKEIGYQTLRACAFGALLLLLPCLLLGVGLKWRGVGISLLPPKLRLETFSFPGGLAGDAILGPIPYVILVGIIFLGVLYPILRLRFSARFSAAFFCAVFVAAVTPVATTMAHPWYLTVIPTAISGLLIFYLMESGGLYPALLAPYFMMVLRNTSVLLGSNHLGSTHQGWLASGVIIGLLATGAVIFFKGRAASAERSYEPQYLIRMRERERFARELEIAKGIQQRFLPKSMPELEGFRVAATCVPAMEVGGDMYDFLEMADGKWLMLIGDVSGKGVKAAFYMTLTKGIIHAITGMESDQEKIIRRLNGLFKKLSEDGVFLTLCAVIIDPAKRTAQLLSAGHNPPLILRDGKATILDPRGIVLGVVDEESFVKSLRDVTVQMQAGDALVFYTDGVSEAMNRREEEFGMERLVEAVEKASGGECGEILHEVVHSVQEFADGAPQADDFTLLVVRAHEA